MKNRSLFQQAKDFATFPVRAVTLFDRDRCGLSSLVSERFDFVSREVKGYCLDVGCGPHNRFITEYRQGNGKGIDVYRYDGLSDEHIVPDISRFPFDAATFDTVTFIANLNHVPRSLRDAELSEAYRALKQGGNIVVTMGNPLAEIAVHKVVALYDRVFGTRYDLDSERGMHDEEEYFLTDAEILGRLTNAGFRSVGKKYFWTQWCLNHLFVGWKPDDRQRV